MVSVRWWAGCAALGLACQLDSQGLGGGGASSDGGTSAAASTSTASDTGTNASTTAGTSGTESSTSASTTDDTAGATGDQDWLRPFAFRKPITVASTQAALAEFTVGILVSNDVDLSVSARADGFDIAFTAADGVTRLDYERERYDGAGGLVAWVRTPLSDNDETLLYLYYGDPDANDQQTPTAAWTSTVAGLWHLAETPTDPEPQYRDSSGSGNPGTVLGTAQAAAGIAGVGIRFDGTGGEVSLGDPADESLDFDTNSFSYELWISAPSSAGNFDMPWYKGGSSAGNTGYDMELGSGQWRAGVVSNGQIVVGDFGPEGDFLGRWVHLAVVVDRADDVVRLFADGTMTDEDDISGFTSMSTAIPASIGRSDNYFPNGVVDEVRVYGEALPAAWIAAEHANLTDENFVVVGAQQAAP